MWIQFLLNLLVALGSRDPYISHNGTISKGTPLSDFLPYGSNAGDSVLPTLDDANIEVKLKGSPFNLFNNTYTSLFLNSNGGATFGQGINKYNNVCGSLDIPMIAPYWADVDTRKGGSVYYRQSTNKSDLEKTKAVVQRAFPSTKRSLNLQWAFITTWNDVAFYDAWTPSSKCPGSSLRNTFQTILVQSEKNSSFVLFLYNKLTWTAGVAQGTSACTGRNPMAGNPAKAGFDYGDGKTFISLPGSCTEDITNITQKSNFLEKGKWAFKVTDGVINTCDVDCSNGDGFQIDPYDCSAYYECSNNVPIKMICPKMSKGGRLVFDPVKNTCVFPKDSPCKPICS